MFIGLDRNDNLVYIDEAVSRGDYFCPTCGKPIIPRKGEINIHHFAHKRGHVCSDSWNSISNSGCSYDISEWHNDWEKQYPKVNRETVITLGDVKHRGDVVVDNTVIEFQHSPISSSHFQERTNFYLNAGYKVIWLFDYIGIFTEKKVSSDGSIFMWERPNSTFRDITCTRENVDIFFQISDEKIIRVDNISPFGFEIFKGSKPFTKADFLEYTGLENGFCLPPNTQGAEENNQRFIEFMEKYPIPLDKAQQRAVQMVNGANLVLSVPGSGKTTVLTYRLGYLAIEKRIRPNRILAITYTNAAEDEMKKRLQEYFHGDIKGNISIRTINSLALEIINDRTDYGFKTAGFKETKKIIINGLKKFGITFYADTIKLYDSAISYIKSKINQEAYFNQVIQDKKLDPCFKEFFKYYNEQLHEKKLIDFNDQNNLALKYLQEDKTFLTKFQAKYPYICVDEAQDTNQVQYELIKLIAGSKPNIFMVGDEDQSIYGFNGSYPEALLNFRDEYDNPFILKLERNYRSTDQIVETSKMFIDKNTKRNVKDMYSYRGDGKNITINQVTGIKEQAEFLVKEAKKNNGKMAILYRENNSGIVLSYFLNKAGVDYCFIKSDIELFEASSFKKTLGYLKLSVYPRDFISFQSIFQSICKNIFYKTAKIVMDTVSKTKENIMDVLVRTVDEGNFYDKNFVQSRVRQAREIIYSLKEKPIEEAIEIAVNWSISNDLQNAKIKEILTAISDEHDTIDSLLNKIERLKTELIEKKNKDSDVKLSTFHSAKGLEFDCVYLADIYDGVCPLMTNEENPVLYQEERRLFYVGMTRARDELHIIGQKEKESTFIREVNEYIGKFLESTID